MNNFVKYTLILCGAFIYTAGAQARANAQELNYEQLDNATRTAAEPYVSSLAIVPEQSQLVYYYPRETSAEPLNIYIDKQFHTALLPGEFTTVCMKAGSHFLNAAMNDAPLYRQKETGGLNAPFEGGKTYFVRIAKYQELVSESVYRDEAEKELQDMQRNNRIINRASAVESCRYSANSNANLAKLSVLFKFAGSSYAQMESDSKVKLRELINTIKSAGTVNAIRLIGHADGIGKDGKNQRLSEARAETVRRILTNSGIDSAIITVQGDGVDPVAIGCSTQPADTCNKQSRRVDIIINDK